MVQPEPQHAEAWLSPETNVSPNLRRQTIVSQESHHGLGGREQQSAILIFFGSVISFPHNIKRDAVWQEHGGVSTHGTQITPTRHHHQAAPQDGASFLLAFPYASSGTAHAQPQSRQTVAPPCLSLSICGAGLVASISVSRLLSPCGRCLSPPLRVASLGRTRLQSGEVTREKSSQSRLARDLQMCFCPSNPDLGSAGDRQLQGSGTLRSSSETVSFSCSFGCLKPVAYCFPLFFSLFKNSPFFHLEKNYLYD